VTATAVGPELDLLLPEPPDALNGDDARQRYPGLAL
jgi:hypothetical protein